MLLAAAINPAFLEMQKSGCIWGEMRSQTHPCSVLSCSESCQNSTAIVCKGYKLGRDATGSSFPIAAQCWTAPPYCPKGHLSGYTSDFSMQSCISAPCFNFLPHQCSPYPALCIPLWLYPSTAHPWGCVLGERLAWVLCVEGWKEPPRSALFLPSQGCLHQATVLSQPLHALSSAGFHSLPLLGESGHVCSRQVSCLPSWKHWWSFPCATTGSSLRLAPGTDCSAQGYFHTFPTKTASLSA